MSERRDEVRYKGRKYLLTEDMIEYLDELQARVDDHEIIPEESVYLTLRRAGHPVTAQPEFDKENYFKPHSRFGQVLLSGKPVFHRGVGLFWKRRNDDLLTNVSWEVIDHSPDGFEIGFGGSGVADLALNAMAALFPVTDRTPEDEINVCIFGRVTRQAWRLHKRFKNHFLQYVDRDKGSIRWSDIQHWLAAQERRADEEDKVEVYPYDPAISGLNDPKLEQKMAGLLMVRRAVDLYWRAFYLVNDICSLCSSTGQIHINALADDASALIFCFCARGHALRSYARDQRAEKRHSAQAFQVEGRDSKEWGDFAYEFDCPECQNTTLLKRRPDRDNTTVNCHVCRKEVTLNLPPRKEAP